MNGKQIMTYPNLNSKLKLNKQNEVMLVAIQTI